MVHGAHSRPSETKQAAPRWSRQGLRFLPRSRNYSLVSSQGLEKYRLAWAHDVAEQDLGLLLPSTGITSVCTTIPGLTWRQDQTGLSYMPDTHFTNGTRLSPSILHANHEAIQMVASTGL